MCKDAVVVRNKPKAVTLEADVDYLICSCGRSKDGIFCDGSHVSTECLPKKTKVQKSKQYLICMCKSSANFPFCDGTHSIYSDDEVGKSVEA